MQCSTLRKIKNEVAAVTRRVILKHQMLSHSQAILFQLLVIATKLDRSLGALTSPNLFARPAVGIQSAPLAGQLLRVLVQNVER
jgi:hypothetical protein